MRAMMLEAANRPLALRDLDQPVAGPGQVLIEVEACGICRTDLHILDGDLDEPKLPLVCGHQIVGRVIGGALDHGTRVGVPWLGATCGCCDHCGHDRENLCDDARFTGYHIDGGFAEYCVADARYAFAIPDDYPAAQAAPLLCAGMIGYRSWRMAPGAQRLGLYGFGAAAHILIQVARHAGQEVFAFTSPGDASTQEFARGLGATWAGGSDEVPPVELDAAILFAPVGALVPAALRAVRKGGTVVCGGIHMSDIPQMPYATLWGERSVKSVANLTRRDGEEFLALAPKIPVQTTVTMYPLERVNEALDDLRHGRFEGAAVIIP